MKQILALLLIPILLLTGCKAAVDLSTLQSIEPVDTGVDPESWARIPGGPFPSGEHDHLVDLDQDYQIMITDVTNQQYASYLNQALEKGDIQVGLVDVIENENTSQHYGVYGYYPGDPFDGHKHEDRIQAGNKLYLPLENLGERIVFDGTTFSVEEGFGNHPATMLSWFGADAYCQFYGWHLPSELEWEKAARGDEIGPDGHGRAFPWGSEIARNQANYYCLICAALILGAGAFLTESALIIVPPKKVFP